MTPPDAVTFALGHIRASSGHALDRDSFVAALDTGVADISACAALESHLHESGPAELASLVAKGVTSFAKRAALARQLLPPAHPNRLWLEMALPA